MDGTLYGDQYRTAAPALLTVVMSISVFDGCHTTCRTAASWTRAETSMAVGSSSHTQTMFGRVWSTVAMRAASALNAIVDTPRGRVDVSAIVLNADEPDDSAYSKTPSAEMQRSRQMRGVCWSISKTCDSEVEQEN